MSRVTRVATAVVLAVAVAAFPAVLDRCAESCAEHHDAVASAPSCHHVTPASTRIGHVPTPCGHDHNGTVVTSAKSSASLGRSIGSTVMSVVLPTPAPAASGRGVVGQSPPGTSVAVDGGSLPLRL